MSELPADAIPVINWPEYAITPNGQVWRVAPCFMVDARDGPVPRMVKLRMMGPNSPAVTLSGGRGRLQSRTIRSLLREHFGDGWSLLEAMK